jgi:hypothetical protein
VSNIDRLYRISATSYASLSVEEMCIRVMTLPGRVAVSSDASDEYYITTKGNYWKDETTVEQDTRKILGLILDHPSIQDDLKLSFRANFGAGIDILFHITISYEQVREIAMKLSR